MYTCSVVQCQKILRKVLVIRLLFLLQEWRSMMQSMVVRQVVEKFGLIQAVFAHGELERGGAGRIPPVLRTDHAAKRCHERSTLMKFQVEKKLFFKRSPETVLFIFLVGGFAIYVSSWISVLASIWKRRWKRDRPPWWLPIGQQGLHSEVNLNNHLCTGDKHVDLYWLCNPGQTSSNVQINGCTQKDLRNSWKNLPFSPF